MFNPQLDFGSKFEFEGTEFNITQRKVTVLNTEPIASGLPFLDLKEGDVFTASDENDNSIEDEFGNKVFLAVSNPYRDELGIPCIDIRPYRLPINEKSR